MTPPTLSALLVRWEEAHHLRRDLCAAELCPEWPALHEPLQRLIDALRSALSRPAEDETLAPPTGGDLLEVLPVPEEAETARADIPGYEMLGELARGGMGVVYVARQRGLNRLCAVKMILAGSHAGDAELARFQTEAEAVARLRHPNIVQVYEVGRHQDMPFLSMEFCDGGSLARRLAGTPIEPKLAAGLVRTLAEAMQAAHRVKIVHRDLKPANVMLASPPGMAPVGGRRRRDAIPLANLVPKITDFGLAKKLDEKGQTQTGAVLGTPAYMAPEQAQGKKDVGPAADVYALGAILYECLTGRPPFRAATALDTILQVISDEPAPPRRLNARVPVDLETVCLKCLHKEPGKRYATAQALADDLGRYLAGEPIQARSVGNVGRAIKWARRKPAAAAVCCMLFAALVLGCAWIITFARSAIQARQTEQRTRDERAAMERALLAVARQNDADATSAADALQKAMSQTTDPRTLRTLALSLAIVVPRMNRDWAAVRCNWAGYYLIQAMSGISDTSGLLDVAGALVILAPRMGQEDAERECTKAAEFLIRDMEKPTRRPTVTQMRDLALTLSRLAARMEPKQAETICTRAADALTQELLARDPNDRAFDHLAPGLAALAPWLGPESAAETAAVVLSRPPMGMIQNQCLAALLERERPARRSRRTRDAARAVAVLARPDGLLAAAAMLVHNAQSAPPPLPAQALVDLLKTKSGRGRPQRLLLDQLQRHYHRRFADVPAFVRFAEANQLKLDLTGLPGK